jgi:hypothetical protein
MADLSSAAPEKAPRDAPEAAEQDTQRAPYSAW